MGRIAAIVAIVAGAATMQVAGIPAGAMVGALLVAATLQLRGWSLLTQPVWCRRMGIALIGALLGAKFNLAAFAEMAGDMGVVLGSLALLLLSSWGLALFLSHLSGVDASTSYLATVPGGMVEMAAMSLRIGGNTEVVAAAHLIRLVTVVLLTPVLATVVAG